MNRTALLMGIGASLVLAAGPASAAGSCAAEIAALEQAMANNMDASSSASSTTTDSTGTTGTTSTVPMEGDTVDDSTNANSSISPGDATSPDSQANAGAGGTTSGTDNATTTTPDATAEASGATGTIPMEGDTLDNSTNANSAVSPGDATSPDLQANATGAGTSTEPTVSEASRAGQMNTSAGGRDAALASLSKAKNYAAAGQEEACMIEVNSAKTAFGSQ